MPSTSYIVNYTCAGVNRSKGYFSYTKHRLGAKGYTTIACYWQNLSTLCPHQRHTPFTWSWFITTNPGYTWVSWTTYIKVIGGYITMSHVYAYANGCQKDLVYRGSTFLSIPNTIGLLETPTSFLCAGLWNPFSRRIWEITLLTLASRWEAWRNRRDGQQRDNDCNITVCSVHCMVPAIPTNKTSTKQLNNTSEWAIWSITAIHSPLS